MRDVGGEGPFYHVNGAIPEHCRCPCKRDRRDDHHAHHRDENVHET